MLVLQGLECREQDPTTFLLAELSGRQTRASKSAHISHRNITASAV